jgi:hypothetical protein
MNKTRRHSAKQVTTILWRHNARKTPPHLSPYINYELSEAMAGITPPLGAPYSSHCIRGASAAGRGAVGTLMASGR